MTDMETIKLLSEVSTRLGRTQGIGDGLARELNRMIDGAGHVDDAEHVLNAWSLLRAEQEADDG